MYILTAVRTSLGPVYLVPHGTVIPPGDGSQSTRWRTTSWCSTAVEVEAQGLRQVRPPLLSHTILTRETGTKTHMYFNAFQCILMYFNVFQCWYVCRVARGLLKGLTFYRESSNKVSSFPEGELFSFSSFIFEVTINININSKSKSKSSYS